MKIAIVGSRTFSDYELLSNTVKTYCKANNIFPKIIVSGGAKGADTLAERFAKENNLEKKIFHPNWELLGRNACSARNTEIVEFSDLVFAFWDGQSPGTKDSITKAENLGKTVIIKTFSNP